MTKKQRINQTIKSGIFGLLTGIVLGVVGYLWTHATNLLIDIEGFGLGRMVLWFPMIGYGVIGVGIVVFAFGILQLIRGFSAKNKHVEKSEAVKKTQQDAIVAERSLFDKGRIKGVIFDLDGTLLDTIDDLTDALNSAITVYGYPAKTSDEVMAVVGNGMANMVRRVVNPETTEEEVQEILKAFLDAYDMNYQNKTKPYEGIHELLRELNSKGYLLGVISNKRLEYTQELIKNLFSDIPFVDVIGDHVEYPRKPDPTTTQLIVQEMMVSSSQVVFVGDSQVDIETAHNANVPVIACTWGFRSISELDEAKPDYYAHTPKEIYDIIVSINHSSASQS